MRSCRRSPSTFLIVFAVALVFIGVVDLIGRALNIAFLHSGSAQIAPEPRVYFPSDAVHPTCPQVAANGCEGYLNAVRGMLALATTSVVIKFTSS